MTAFILYLIIGFLIGILSGLLGIGGGLIAVPAIDMSLAAQGLTPTHLMHISTATSLSTVVFTSIASIRAFHREGDIRWDWVKKLLPSLLISSVAGIIISHSLSTHDLRVLFGVFVFIVAMHLLFEQTPKLSSEAQKPRPLKYPHLLGSCAGLFAGLLGVGGSVLMIPVFLHFRLNMRQASGTSVACAFPIAVMAVLTTIISSWGTPGLPPYSSGFIYWPATLGIVATSIFSVSIGAWIARHSKQSTLRKFFAIFLIFVSIDMLFK